MNLSGCNNEKKIGVLIFIKVTKLINIFEFYSKIDYNQHVIEIQ